MRMETINYYDEFTVREMITNAVKHDRMKCKNRSKRKARELKQKLAFKILCLLCIIGGITAASMVNFDNGGCLVVALIGLMGLVIPFDMEITL